MHLLKHNNVERIRRFLTNALCLLVFFACLTLGNKAFSTTVNNTGEISVVVSIHNPIKSLSKKDVIDIYMGRFNTFPNGLDAEPMDLPDGSAEKKAFYERLVGKNERKIKAYWSRLLFSGRAQPPIYVESAQEINNLFGLDDNSIAYVFTENVTEEMKVVFQL
jgi:hypothetical protein